jgi:hypothetical protein
MKCDPYPHPVSVSLFIQHAHLSMNIFVTLGSFFLSAIIKDGGMKTKCHLLIAFRIYGHSPSVRLFGMLFKGYS